MFVKAGLTTEAQSSTETQKKQNTPLCSQVLHTHSHLNETDNQRQPCQQEQNDKVIEERFMRDVIATRQRIRIGLEVRIVANLNRRGISQPHDGESNGDDNQIQNAKFFTRAV